jgi:uncharacterized cupin superfamily protein
MNAGFGNDPTARLPHEAFRATTPPGREINPVARRGGRARQTIGMLMLTLALGASAEEATVQPVAIVNVSATAPPDLNRQAVTEYPFMRVTSGDKPSYGVREDFVSPDGRLRVDYSEYTPMTLALTNWPADEFMYFVDGQVEIRDSGGAGRIYGPGDMIVMPKGFTGTWRQLSAIKKISVTYGSFE